ncbi:MAG TPA: PEP-CTERM sorting domain-containing protein [Rhodanobacteraceae bacterium]
MGINDRGQVVGSSGIWYLEPNGERAFLYEDGHMFDLNDLVTDRADFDVLFAADAINDRGQIVGFGSLTNGGFDAFLATPLNMVAVPEPSDFWMLMAGLLGIGLLGMRRRLGYM